MSSSNKTSLGLNVWSPGDLIGNGAQTNLMEDLNADSQIINQNLIAIKSDLTAQGQTFNQKVTDTQTQLTNKINEDLATLGVDVLNVSANLYNHSWDEELHLTEDERQNWNKGGVVMGIYTGNGTATRKITLGYRPRLGGVFAVGQPIVRAIFASQVCDVYSAFFATNGAGGGVSVENDGFTLSNSAAAINGINYRLNQSATSYIYFLWK